MSPHDSPTDQPAPAADSPSTGLPPARLPSGGRLVLRHGLRQIRPRTSNQLWAFIDRVLGFHIPRRALVEGHDAPFAYLEHAFFEDRGPRDALVWANRGGGKTQLGAIATLLDLLFKPGVQVRILAGSFDQASKMYEYLRRMLEQPGFGELVDGRITMQGVRLRNGSRVEVLSQSERAVRGQRIHKLRCDEVDLFHPEIWSAAQMITQSETLGGRMVHGSIEALSTMHRAGGLMQDLVDRITPDGCRLFRWSLLDVMERCPDWRRCDGCALERDCAGRAKERDAPRGHLRIDDLISQARRVDEMTWKTEMLCERPGRGGAVYPEFDAAQHVRGFTIDDPHQGRWVAGIDFGYRAPTVMLWAWLSPADVLHVVDEHVAREWTTAMHLDAAAQRPWPKPAWVAADPAGNQRNEQTGESTVQLWRRAGWTMRTWSRRLEPGIKAVRARLRRADGSIGLVIHPRCRELIRSLTRYHYHPDLPTSITPVKDGSEHAADALRYMVQHLVRPAGKTRIISYFDPVRKGQYR